MFVSSLQPSLPPSPSRDVALGDLSHVPTTPKQHRLRGSSSRLRREVLFFPFLRYNSYFSAQTAAGKGNITTLILSASFPGSSELGFYRWRCRGVRGSPSAAHIPLSLFCGVQPTFGSVSGSSTQRFAVKYSLVPPSRYSGRGGWCRTAPQALC